MPCSASATARADAGRPAGSLLSSRITSSDRAGGSSGLTSRSGGGLSMARAKQRREHVLHEVGGVRLLEAAHPSGPVEEQRRVEPDESPPRVLVVRLPQALEHADGGGVHRRIRHDLGHGLAPRAGCRLARYFLIVP